MEEMSVSCKLGEGPWPLHMVYNSQELPLVPHGALYVAYTS